MSFDLIVIGAGFAGLTVGIRAAELGLHPLILEAGEDENYQCNSRYSTGSCHVAFNTPWTNPEELTNTIINNAGGCARRDLAVSIGQNARRAIDWLKIQGASFEDHPRRIDHMPMLSPLREMRAGLDWETGGANLLLKKMANKLVKNGGEIRLGTRAEKLYFENGKIFGLKATNKGVHHDLLAKSVVIADGGFQGNPKLVEKYIGCSITKLQRRNAGTGVGDGLRMAIEVGANIAGMDCFYGHVLSRDAMTNEKLWPYPQVDVICSTSIVVNASGKRFSDEGLGGIYLANSIARIDDPLSTTAIFDSDVWEEAKTTDNVPPNPSLPDAGGTILKASTIQGLAEKADLNARQLATTITSYNKFLYQKEAFLSPPRTQTRYSARPIIKPPFYAIPLCAGITVTSGGVSVNGKGEVINKNGCPIPGLYAAGSTVGGIEGGPSASYVGGLIKSFCIGLLTAESIANSHGSPAFV